MNWPNRISIFRIILIPIFITAMIYYKNAKVGDGEIYRVLAIILFSLATMSDAVDGFLARFLNQKTELGVILDPIADKCLLTSAIIVLSLPIPALNHPIPYWYVCLVIGRDFVILVGYAIVHIIMGKVRVVPSIVGKITTAFQMIVIFWTLFKLPHLYYWLIFSAIFTVYSFIGYLFFGSSQLQEHHPDGKVL